MISLKKIITLILIGFPIFTPVGGVAAYKAVGLITSSINKSVLAGGNDFRIKIWTNKSGDSYYREGERLIIYILLEKDSYLKLDYYQADGQVVHLVPNLFSKNNRFKAGKIYTFGSKLSGHEFFIRDPFGIEAVKVIASTSRFVKDIQSQKNVESADEYMQLLADGISEKPKNTMMAEEMIEIRTIPKDTISPIFHNKQMAPRNMDL